MGIFTDAQDQLDHERQGLQQAAKPAFRNHGEEVRSALAERDLTGKPELVYIDPPFVTDTARIAALEADKAALLAALGKIEDGNTMSTRENWTLGDVIQEHYKIVRDAIRAVSHK